MTKYVIKNPKAEVGSVDLRDHMRSLTFTRTASEVDATAFGNGSMERLPGLYDGTVDIEWHQDFDTSEVYDQLKDLLATKVTLTVDPTPSNTQDEAEVEVLVSELPLFGGAVGELSTFSTSWPFSDTVTFTLPPPLPLYTSTLRVGEYATDRSGFGRSTQDFNAGGLTHQYIDDALAAGERSRIIWLYMDVSNNALYMRVNRRQDFRGKWLAVYDRTAAGWDYTELGFSSGTGAESLTIDLASHATWSSNAWEDGDYNPVGIFDRDPRGSTLTIAPVELDVITMQVGNAANDLGFWHGNAGYGGLHPDRDVHVPDDGFTNTPAAGPSISRFFWDDSAGEMVLRMDSSADAQQLDKLWMTYRSGTSAGSTLVKTQLTRSGQEFDFSPALTTQPTWISGQTYRPEIKFYDQDPDTASFTTSPVTP